MRNIRFFSENFQFLVVKFSIYLNKHVFVMLATGCHRLYRNFFFFLGGGGGGGRSFFLQKLPRRTG